MILYNYYRGALLMDFGLFDGAALEKNQFHGREMFNKALIYELQKQQPVKSNTQRSHLFNFSAMGPFEPLRGHNNVGVLSGLFLAAFPIKLDHFRYLLH